MTTLIDACEKGQLEKAKVLIEKGANVNVKKSYGYTALMYACIYGYLEIATLLIENGADINDKNSDGDTALTYACTKRHLEIVELLIENGGDIHLAIKECKNSDTIKILKKFIKKEIYKGQINDQTEIECGICLSEMISEKQEIIQCFTCKKCVHNECNLKWKTVNNSCVYCRN